MTLAPSERKTSSKGPTNLVTWLAPIEAQLAGLRVDDRMVAEVIAVLSRADQPAIPIDHARFDRMRRQLALEVADGKIGEQEFLAAMRRLKEERAGIDEMLPSGPGISATEAVDYIRQFAATWAKAKPASRAALVQSVYEEIVVRGEQFVKVRLTQDAYAHGFALALPAQVSVPLLPGRGRPRKHMSMARPTGVGRADAISEVRNIPIDGAEEWRRAARRSSA